MLIHGEKIGDHRKTVEGHVHSAFIVAWSHHMLDSLRVTCPSRTAKLECECEHMCASGGREGQEEGRRGGTGRKREGRDQEEEPPLPFVHFLSEFDTAPRVITSILQS